MKTKQRTLAVLLVLVIVLGGLLWFVSRSNAAEEAASSAAAEGSIPSAAVCSRQNHAAAVQYPAASTMGSRVRIRCSGFSRQRRSCHRISPSSTR